MARVAGRIKFLVVSIKTITGIRTGGVPWGIKWASMDLGLFNQPYSIKPIQIGSDRAKVLVMWLVAVKVYGDSPHKLLIIIRVKIETATGINPEAAPGPVKVLNSAAIIVKTIFQGSLIFLGITQNKLGITTNTKASLTQLRAIVEEEGSKTEKILTIIISGWKVLF